MNVLLIFLGIWAIIGIVGAIFLVFVISKSIGFKSLLAIFKTKMKMKKGWGLVLMFHRTGIPKYIPVKFGADLLEPNGEGKGRYVYKSQCVYYNEYGIPTIAYRENDANPIDPKSGIQNNTSPNVLENIIARAIKAEKEYSGDVLSFLKEHWVKILLLYLGPLAIIGFIALQQQDTIANLATQAGKNVIVNASQLGK